MMWQILLVASGVFLLWEVNSGWNASYTRTFDMLAGLLLIVDGFQQGLQMFRQR